MAYARTRYDRDSYARTLGKSPALTHDGLGSVMHDENNEANTHSRTRDANNPICDSLKCYEKYDPHDGVNEVYGNHKKRYALSPYSSSKSPRRSKYDGRVHDAYTIPEHDHSSIYAENEDAERYPFALKRGLSSKKQRLRRTVASRKKKYDEHYVQDNTNSLNFSEDDIADLWDSIQDITEEDIENIWNENETVQLTEEDLANIWDR